MDDELITYNTAKSAKEKGFTLDILYYGVFKGDDYYVGTLDEMYFNANGVNKRKELVSTPTQSLLQKWLREQHKIEVSVCSNASGFLWMIDKSYHGGNISGGTFIKDFNNNGPNLSGEWETYEEALEDGLYQALKLIK